MYLHHLFGRRHIRVDTGERSLHGLGQLFPHCLDGRRVVCIAWDHIDNNPAPVDMERTSLNIEKPGVFPQDRVVQIGKLLLRQPVLS